LYLALRGSRGVEGLAMAGVIAMSLNAGATLIWARARHGAPRAPELLDTLARTSGIAIAAATVATLLQQGGAGRAGAALDLALGGAGFGVVAVAGLWLIGDPELREFARSGARQLRGSFRKRQ